MICGECVLFSLIVPTRNPRNDVRCLAASNSICRDFASRLPPLHLKTELKVAVRLRNRGPGSVRHRKRRNTIRK